MIYDKNFLLQLDQCQHKTIYARVTALNLQEYPIETIEGRVTQGSINIDGASAVRRTCSLTLVASDFNYSDYLWSFNTKFKLEIGVQNTIDPRYDDIIWFKQGIYIISSFNTSRSTSNFSITIQGKDKMCRLNGDLGGTINSTVDFGTIEEEDTNGNWVIRKIPIKDIIRNMVHQYGGEPLHNIIINDVPDEGYELLEYRYDVPMYLYKTKGQNTYANVTLDGTIKVTATKSDPEQTATKDVSKKTTTLAELLPTDFEMLVDPLMGVTEPADIMVSGSNTIYTFAKIEYGQTAGYRQTSLTYAGDLIANIGENITSVLDKIKNMLGEFEYFYDLDGHFVFQKKQAMINTLYSPVQTNGQDDKEYVIALKHSEAIAYYFEGGELITTFNNNPNIANLRNDFSVWGQRNAISGAQVPVHLRYAIDKKPTYYKSIAVSDAELISYNEKYGTELRGQVSIEYRDKDWDWREIIYQMALDYYKYGHLDDFEVRVAQTNPDYYPLGTTGYEQYYIDLQGFWRELYNPGEDEQNRLKDLDLQKQEKKKHYFIISSNRFNELENIYTTIYKRDGEDYSAIGSFDDNLFDYYVEATEDDMLELQEKYNELSAIINEWKQNYYQSNNDQQYWNKNVFEHPEVLNFWFDFLDTNGELSQFSIKAIGSRPKAINDTNIKAIYFKTTPEILFIKDQSEANGGKKYIQVPDIEQMFSISAQGKSAKDKLDELIYQHGYCSESVTINCIPIYYLQPNSRIHISDEETYIDGDYIVSKITIPLSYNGTMSLTATKAAETFLY